MIEGLLEAIADFHRTRPNVGAAIAAMTDQVVDALDSVLAEAAASAEALQPVVDPLPVMRHLDAVDTAQGDARIDAILTEFVAISDHLPWTQTTGYLDRLPQSYLDNYGYVRLVGPGAVIEHASAMVGIGVWGPNLDYPLHEHEAEELYDVLHGTPEFRIDDGDFASKPPGSSVHHEPWMRHAQRFGDETTVLLYAWTGNVQADAVLVD